ncbi:MAG: hypothetical protein ACR2O0_06620 [Rhizobiaceae bacterium]
MAAIIEFPKEASIWRQKRSARSMGSEEPGGKVLLFTGVRYAQKTADESTVSSSRAKLGKDMKA